MKQTATAPAFSVVIPLFNKEATVERALRSVICQTDQAFEIIVVDNGSTDRSLDAAQAVRDIRLRVVREEEPGVSTARNRGIGESRGAWIAFLDADDEWEADHLETLSTLREDHPDCSVVATRYLLGMEGEGTRPAIVNGLAEDWSGLLADYFAVAARSDPPLWTSAVAVERRAIKAVGLFPVGVTAGEDLLIWARLAVRYPIAYSMKTTAIFWREPACIHSGRPTRVPDRDDLVGRGLQSLLLECRPGQRAGIKKYLALWHKMRASIYMRLGRRTESSIETLKAIRYDPLAWKLYAYLLLAHCPSSIQRRVFRDWGSHRWRTEGAALPPSPVQRE